MGEIMSYSLNLGIWGSVFAVPSEIVDKHLRLAGAAQLKVLLWILRHNTDSFTDEDIAQALSMQSADVRDSIQYWVQVGVIILEDGVISPPQKQKSSEIITVTEQKNKNEFETSEPISEQNQTQSDKENTEKNTTKKESKPSRMPVQPPKPDIQYLVQRMGEDSEVAYLMQAADGILGRMTSNNDKCILLNMHEYDGLPVEVILMLLQYACDIGKPSMRYIDKMAITWADEEINTLDRAEKKIKQLTEGREASRKVLRIMGRDDHDPTREEIMYAERWLSQWNFSSEMIREAYEICINQKGQYMPKYTNGILKGWHSKGISTIEQITAESAKHQKTEKSYGAAYDLSEYENANPFDEED